MVRLKEKVGAASKNVVQMRNVTGSIVYIVLFAFGKKRVTQSNSLLPIVILPFPSINNLNTPHNL